MILYFDSEAAKKSLRLVTELQEARDSASSSATVSEMFRDNDGKSGWCNQPDFNICSTLAQSGVPECHIILFTLRLYDFTLRFTLRHFTV